MADPSSPGSPNPPVAAELEDEGRLSRLSDWWGALAAELDKRILTMLRYRGDTVAMVVTAYLLNIALYVGATAMLPDGTEPDPASFAGLALGVVLWQLAEGSIRVYNQQLATEAFTGTLQQLYMSKVGITWILLGRAVAESCTSVVVHAVVLVAVALTFGITFYVPVPEVALILALTLVGMWGVGLMLGGATLLFKRVDQISQLLHFLLLVLAGVMFPVERMPSALKHIGNLIPLTHGIRTMRSVMVEGLHLADLAAELGALSASSLACFLLGLSLFSWCDHAARRRGSLSRY